MAGTPTRAGNVVGETPTMAAAANLKIIIGEIMPTRAKESLASIREIGA